MRKTINKTLLHKKIVLLKKLNPKRQRSNLVNTFIPSGAQKPWLHHYMLTKLVSKVLNRWKVLLAQLRVWFHGFLPRLPPSRANLIGIFLDVLQCLHDQKPRHRKEDGNELEDNYPEENKVFSYYTDYNLPAEFSVSHLHFDQLQDCWLWSVEWLLPCQWWKVLSKQFPGTFNSITSIHIQKRKCNAAKRQLQTTLTPALMFMFVCCLPTWVNV